MIDLQKINSLKSDKVWFFRFKKIDLENYLITNETWKFSYLDKNEFWEFISWNMNSWEKYEELLEKKFLKSENYEEDMAYLYAKKNRHLWLWPTLHIIVTTLRCNHKCQYCHAAVAPMTAKEMDMTIETAKKVVDTIFYTPNNEIIIEFQWWESLVNWDVVKYIVEYWEVKAQHLAKKVTFAIVSNLTLMDEEKMNYLLDHSVDISTSIDWDEETHNFNRTFKEWNSFISVMYWIKKINEEYQKRWIQKRVWALLTVTKKTLSKPRETIDTYRKLWLDGIFLRPLNPYWFAAADFAKLWYTTEEFVEFYKECLEYISELNKKWILFIEKLTSIYLLKILTENDPNYLDERSPCWACIWQVAYNYDWKVYSCDEWRMLGRMWDQNFMMTDLNKISFDEHPWYEAYNSMINSETTKVMVQASTLDGLPWYNESVYKPYIWVCPIHSYKLSGNLIPNYAKDHKRMLDYAILDFIFEKLRVPEEKEIYEDWVNWLTNRGSKNKRIVSQCEASI
jgi:uncharacterized protein